MQQYGRPVTSVNQRKNSVLRDVKRSMGDFLREVSQKKKKRDEESVE